MKNVDLPTNIKLLISRIIEILNPERIYLYGSRARGDNGPTSDFDIAVSSKADKKAWSNLHWELEEGLITLYPVDILDLESASPNLKEQVLKEGKILHENT